ncbi:hypothetical protein [Paeniglutamicibacter kerguelensis]
MADVAGMVLASLSDADFCAELGVLKADGAEAPDGGEDITGVDH